MEISYNDLKNELFKFNKTTEIYTLEDIDHNVFEYEKYNQESLFLGSYSEILCEEVSEKIKMCKNIIKTYPNSQEYYNQSIEDFKTNIKNAIKKVILIIKMIVSRAISLIQKFLLTISNEFKYTIFIKKIESDSEKISKLVQKNLQKESQEMYSINGIDILNSLPKEKQNNICNYISERLIKFKPIFDSFGKYGDIAFYNILCNNFSNEWISNTKRYSDKILNFMKGNISKDIKTVYDNCISLLSFNNNEIENNIREDIASDDFDYNYNISYKPFNIDEKSYEISKEFLRKILANDMYFKSTQFKEWTSVLQTKLKVTLDSFSRILNNVEDALNKMDIELMDEDSLKIFNKSVKMLNMIIANYESASKSFHAITAAIKHKILLTTNINAMILRN